MSVRSRRRHYRGTMRVHWQCDVQASGGWERPPGVSGGGMAVGLQDGEEGQHERRPRPHAEKEKHGRKRVLIPPSRYAGKLLQERRRGMSGKVRVEGMQGGRRIQGWQCKLIPGRPHVH